MNINHIRRVTVMALAILNSALGMKLLAYPAAYGPFPPGHEPTALALDKCVLTHETKPAGDEIDGALRAYRPATAGSERQQVELVLRGTTNGWAINLRNSQGRELMPASFTNSMTASQMKVDSCDLNGDGQPDFIVNVWSGGCGLAADGSEVTFLLSAKQGYRATSFYLYAFNHQDLVRFKPQGPVYFIFNDLINSDGEKTRDGREHNFWVYELKRIDGNRFVPANADQSSFPKWVRFTDRENHGETSQLTPAQKTRLRLKRESK